MKIKQLLAALLIFCSVAGCMTQTSTLGSSEQLDVADMGYIAATLVSKQVADGRKIMLPSPPKIVADFYENTSAPHLAFSLHTVGDDEWNRQVSIDRFNGEHQLMLLVPVRPGRYWLGNVDASFYGGYRIDTNLKANYPMIVVKKGEITYAGSIQILSKIGKNIAGEVRPGGIYLNIENNFGRDIKAMKSIDNRLTTMPISNGLK